MKRITCILLLILAANSLKATHIVGGEFELIHGFEYYYTLNMVLYFDHIYGNPGAEDPFIQAYIFRKSTGTKVAAYTLPKVSDTFVEYSLLECSSEFLVTRKLLYSINIRLDPQLYDDPEGYYVVWERCCRNQTINNIIYPDQTGQTFILHFPPVIKKGVPFPNSSPSLFQPLRDYACINRFYFADFSGVDNDGDSIAYSLVTPLNSSVSPLYNPGASPIPTPTPPPHPLVEWNTGRNISLENVIPGNPTLKISDEGLLTVTPTLAGLYVFSVLAEEFRDGEKIGEVRRDFQLLVVDCPDAGSPPQILGEYPGSGIFTQNIANVNFNLADEKCINLRVLDPDPAENLRFWVRSPNVKGKLDYLISENFGEVDGDYFELKLCLPDCPIIEDSPITLDVIVLDDACPQGLSDTLRVNVTVEEPPNNSAYFTNSEKNIQKIITEGDNYSLNIEGIDPDKDEMVITILTDDFDPASAGMEFSDFVVDENLGTIQTTFNWESGCDIYDFTEKQNFNLTLLLEDLDMCTREDPDTLRMDLTVLLPPNTDPVISTDLSELTFTHPVNQSLNFNLFATDSDGDSVILNGAGVGFNFEDFGINFQADSALSNVSTSFQWMPNCASFNIKDYPVLQFFFWAEDKDKCKFPNLDSLLVSVALIPEPNEKPALLVSNPDMGSITNNSIHSFEIDDPLVFDLSASDNITDSLVIRAMPIGYDFDNYGINFTSINGFGTASGKFEWDIACELINLSEKSRFQIMFWVQDINACKISSNDTIKTSVQIIEQKNQQPQISFTDNNNYLDIIGDTIHVTVGQEVNLNLIASDGDGDFVSLDLIEKPKTISVDFALTGDFGLVARPMLWNPTCQNLETEVLYKFKFAAFDNKCYQLTDTLNLVVLLEDAGAYNEEFLPPNVFTPNGDGYNDSFELTGITLPVEKQLPPDNCYSSFVSIHIYNRWGREVFSSLSREFKWDGGENPTGTYYYVIEYTRQKYNGTITILE